MEAHHIRMVKMYEPFYQGLDSAEAKELTEWFVKNKYPLGDAKANLMLLDEGFHDTLHKWMIENQMQVYPDTTGKGNFIPGKNKGDLFIRGGAQGQPLSKINAVFPTESIGKTLAERKNAAKLFLENVQAPIEAKLSELVWDQQLKYNPLTQAEFDNQLSVLNDNVLRKELKIAKNIPTDVTKGRPLGGIRDYLSHAKWGVRGALNTPLATKALGAVPFLGAGLEFGKAGIDINKARQQPNLQTIGAAVGSSLVAADQFPATFGLVGETGNQLVRQLTGVDKPAKISTKGRQRYRHGLPINKDADN